MGVEVSICPVVKSIQSKRVLITPSMPYPITEPKHLINSQPANRIVDVSAAKVTNTDISFLVKCLGR